MGLFFNFYEKQASVSKKQHKSVCFILLTSFGAMIQTVCKKESEPKMGCSARIRRNEVSHL